MPKFKFTYENNSLPQEIEVEASNADKAFEKAIEELKEELEAGCYNGDLDEEDI